MHIDQLGDLSVNYLICPHTKKQLMLLQLGTYSVGCYIFIVQYLLQENWKQYSRGFLRDWAEGGRDDDPTANYPFPVPPICDPVASTDSIQTDKNSTLTVNPADQHPLTTNENSSASSHHNDTSNTPRPVRPSLWQLAKVLVAKPPVATSNEVNDARYKLQGSRMLSSSVSIKLHIEEFKITVGHRPIYDHNCSFPSTCKYVRPLFRLLDRLISLHYKQLQLQCTQSSSVIHFLYV